MTKIMLVEDDKSLREIYGVRLLAEGYDIVSAGDGEEALAMAIKERPNLIISDVMMPKVSGYDMLDILRSTTETKNIKVIMMTALSSDDQRARAESLGADRYLVKSQVGIEDVVRVVHEVLGDGPGAAPATPPNATNSTPTPAPVPPPRPAPPASATTQPIQPAQQTQPAPVQPQPLAQPVPTKPVAPPRPASLKTRVIQPIGDPLSPEVDINELLDKELAKEAGISEDMRPTVATTDQQKAIVEQQLDNFEPPSDPDPVEAPDVTPDSPTPPPVTTMPTPGVSPTAPESTPTPPQPPTPIQEASAAPVPTQQPVPSQPPAVSRPAAPPVIPNQPQPPIAQQPNTQTPPPLPEVPTVPVQNQ